MAPKSLLLARVNFPLYSVEAIDATHFLVAGGGGSAKTGISNTIEIYELKFSGDRCVADKCVRFETGENATMNTAVFRDSKSVMLATGQRGDTVLYRLRNKIVREDDSEPSAETNGTISGDANLRHRQSKPPNQVSDKNDNYHIENETGVISYDIKHTGTVQTDFTSIEPADCFQKVVRVVECTVSKQGEGDINDVKELKIVTGGSDGFIRIWKYPDLTSLQEIQAHSNDVDDLDVSGTLSRMVSVSRDCRSIVWDLSTGKKVKELPFEAPVNRKQLIVKYRPRNCKFSTWDEGFQTEKRERVVLYVTYVPSVRQMKNQKRCPCYLARWNPEKLVLERTMDLGINTVSALAVSENGQFIGVASLEGSVSMYIAFSLQRLYHVENSHNIFVTGLEFIGYQGNKERLPFLGNNDANLLSISADNQVKIHHIPARSTVSIVWIVIIVFLVQVVTMFFISLMEF